MPMYTASGGAWLPSRFSKVKPADAAQEPKYYDVPLPNPYITGRLPSLRDLQLPDPLHPLRMDSLSSGHVPVSVHRVKAEKPSSGPKSPDDRPLNVTDVLSYMTAVRVAFPDKPEVHDRFFEIMRDFKSQMCVVVSSDSDILIHLILSIDTPGLVQRVSRLFHGNPTLIERLNPFLPVGHRIDVSALDPNTITVTTPQGTTTENSYNFGIEPPRGIIYPLDLHSIPSQAGHVPLQLDLTPDMSVRGLDSDPLLNVSSRSKRKQTTLSWSPRPTKKRKQRTIPADLNQGDEALLDVLLDRPSSEPGHGVNISINNVVKQVTEVLSKSNIHDQLLGLSVEEAQCTLDFLQDLLDVLSLPVISKRALLKTSLKLTRIHDCVPRCLMLKGFKRTGNYPFALGHFGELWRGQAEGIEVAVKQARVFTSDNNINKVLRQVRREAIIWRQCDHPNVLPFYGIYRDSAPSTYCLVSPFMANGSLRQYMNKTDHPKRHNLALDITRGMNYLHALSIVHGDLKGDNILITDDCRAVIADFGISFVMGTTTFATSSSSSSRRGGTVRWQAPEVLRGGPNSFSADVYSLACVYFEVFHGAIPWSGLNDAAVAMNVCYEKKHLPYPKHLGLTGHAAERWWEVMTKCWAYEPQDRPILIDIMASLHMTEYMSMTPESKWDRSVPTTS
ncbi:uncharacterized protein ARMOST_09909 [Armillaria ostoyae]|uniref:Protein kinase domain-containing protein n=1 Tax=Armillaria ostoyae TaxID=47428 RepID=A0A284RCU0_ARMOS|nr:uncharacterized protein ARMOST_09909 [Armillaria ostoyae]